MHRFAFAAALVALASPALAADDFVLEDAVQVCASCHGEDGVPTEPNIPILWGQQFFYIYTQLKDYAAGRRSHEVMTPMAAEYTRDQQKKLAQHFADLKWPAIPATAQDGDAALAERGIAQGQCSACHGKWEGDSRIPRLAGQQVAYLDDTMLAFKHDVRMNAPDMNNLMYGLDEETISALSRYLAAK